MTLETAQEWHIPPWDVDGLEATPWRRFIWRTRRDLYMTELTAKRIRDRDEMQRQMRNR